MIYFILFLFIYSLRASALDTVATGYRIVNATTPRIDAAGKCRDVNNVSGRDLFVGTRTQPEWWSFISNPPINVNLSVCPVTAEYTNSAQKVMPVSNGALVVESGSAWTNSSWVETTAATTSAIVLTGVVVDLPNSTNVEFEVDIGKGAAGSETVVATVSGVRKSNGSGPWWLDLPIPVDNIAAGQRVAVRIRGSGTSATNARVKLTYYDKPVSGTITTTAMATQVMPTGTSGLSVTPSNTSWGNSAWFQMTASAPTAITVAGLTVNAATNEEFEVDVGTGPAGAETVITTLRDNITNNNGGPYTITLKPAVDNIPAGSRIAVRMRKRGTNTTAWTIKMTYYSSPTGISLPSLPMKWSPSAADSAVLTPSGTAWVSSSWATLIASAPAHLQLAGFQFNPGVAAQYEFDFAVGAAGSEIVIGTVKGICSNTGLMRYFIPIRPLLNAVPLGARLSARIRISATSTAAWGMSVGYYEESTSANKASAYQKSLPASANAITITPANVGWTNSAWVEMSAALSNPILITSVGYDPGQAQLFELDIGTGNAGAESVATTLAGNAANLNGNQILFLASPLLIPANTRIAMRLRKANNNTTAWGFAMNYAEIQ